MPRVRTGLQAFARIPPLPRQEEFASYNDPGLDFGINATLQFNRRRMTGCLQLMRTKNVLLSFVIESKTFCRKDALPPRLSKSGELNISSENRSILEYGIRAIRIVFFIARAFG